MANIEKLKKISADLAAACEALRFRKGAYTVYNPLVYAARPHNMYLKLAGAGPKKVIFLGMNPGPWGMAQTGVPFGEVAAVRDWLGIEAKVGRPAREHPKKPVTGFACPRQEVSGRRFWGLIRARFGTPENFFRDHFVANYCPLAFFDADGANITPDKLRPDEKEPLLALCDIALADTLRLLKPQWVIGVGEFAAKRINSARKQFFADSALDFKIARILHPSPLNPKANVGWETAVTETLIGLGVL